MKSTSSAEIWPIPRPRRLKRLIFTIAALILIVGTLAFAVWIYIRSESFNNYVAGEIKAKLREFGLRAEIGSFGVSWDTQTARLRDLKIYNEQTNQLAATIEKLDTLIEISDPLALDTSREIAIKDVSVEGADFYYEIDGQGRTNLDGVHYVPPKSEAITLNTARTIAMIAGSAIHFKDLSRRIEAEVREIEATAQPNNPPDTKIINLQFNSSAGRASYAGRESRLGNLELTASVSKDGVEIKGLSLESNVGQVKARGRIDNWAAPRYGFDIDSLLKLDEASRVLTSNAESNRGLKGSAAIKGRVDGEGAHYTFKGDASSAEASVANVKLSDASAPFSGSGQGDRVTFASAQIRARSATVDTVKLGAIVINDLKGETAGGETAINAPKISVAAIEAPQSKFNSLSLNNMAAKISGAKYEIKASATLAKGEVRGAQFTGAEAMAAVDNASLTLSGVKGAILGGTVAGEYVLPLTTGSAHRVKASFADVETKSATTLFAVLPNEEQLPISGKISGEVDLSFVGADPRSLNGRIAAHFDGKSDEASESIPITGDVEVKAVNGVFNIDQLKLAASGSSLIGGGSLSVDGASDLRLSLNSTSAEQLVQIARRFDAARSYIEHYEPQIIGDFKFEGRVTGPIDKASIDADVKAGTFGIRDAILGSLAGHVFVSPSEARIEKGSITAPGGESIKFDFAAPLDQNANTGRLEATLDRMNLETILAAAGSPSANQFISGGISGEVHLTGLPAKPSGAGRLSLVGGKIADHEAQLATASVKIDGRNATLEQLEVQLPPQRLTANGSMNLDDYSFKVGGRAERVSLDNFAEVFELKETRVEGGADADFQVSGKVLNGKQIDLDWETFKVELAARGRDVKINGRDTGELKLTAHTSAGGRLDAQLLTGILAATNGKSQLERKPDLIKASVELRAPGRPITIESNLANVDIAPLVSALAPDLSSIIQGAVTGSLRIEGPSLDEKGAPTFDRLRGGLTLMDVNLLVADNPVKIETPTMITIEGSQIIIPPVRVSGEGADLNFGGTLAFSGQAEMNFSISGGINLDRMPQLSEGLLLFGSAQIDARLSGTFDDPKTEGRVDVHGFGLSMGESPIFLSNGIGRFTLAGDEIKLEKFAADANDGRITADGSVKLNRLRPKEWLYNIKVDNAVIAYQEVTATIDGGLTLSGTPQGQTLAGQINIPQAEYKPGIDIDNLVVGNGGAISLGNLAMPPASPDQLKIPPIALDVRVEARDSLIVQNDQINTVGSAILTLSGPVTSPDANGLINVDGGTWRFRGQRLEIIAGSVEFTSNGSKPLLNLQAEGDYNGYHVNIGLSGPLDDPYPVLRSEPQLTSNEILSLITTGRTETGTLLGSRDPSVGAAASLLSSGLISRPTEQLLGISRFQIDPVIGPNSNPAARLTVGQQFSRNLYFSYSTNLGSAAQQTALAEYALSNRFSTLATYTQGSSATLGQQPEAFTIELRGRQRFSLGFNPERTSAPGAPSDSLTRIAKPKLPPAQVKVSDIQNFKLGQGKMRELLPVMTQGFSRAFMRMGERRLKEHLQENGYFFAEVKARCEPENCSGENLRVLYDVDPGAIYDLKEIRIEGSDLIKLKDIAKELQSQPASAAGSVPFIKSLPMVGGYSRGLTSSDRLNSDEEMIRRKLVDTGYRGARVKSRLAFNPDNDDLIVIFDVAEGDQSAIAEVDLRGNVVAQASELTAVTPIQPNDAFSYSHAQLGAQRIKQLYAERGFLEATVEPEFVELGDDRVRLVYNINEGARAVISAIEINGTTKTGDGWVRRYLAFKEGEVLTPEKIRQTQRDLYATNAFREVTIRVEPMAGDGADHKVLVNLTEAKPLLFVYGIGYTTDDKSPRGLLEITNTNLGGSLESLSLRGRASKQESFGQLSFTDLRPFSWKLPTTFSVFYNRNESLRAFLRRRRADGSEEDAQTFGVERFAAFIQTERKLDERTSLRFRYNLERARVFDPDSSDSISIPETVVTRNERSIRLGMFSAGFSRDTRDSALNPTKGQLFSADHSIAARIFGGTESFNKFFATYQRYNTLDRSTPLLSDSTLAFSARVGMASTFNAIDRDNNGVIDDNDRRLPISERFFAGGATTLRGFRFETAGPQAVLEPAPDSRDNCGNPARLLAPKGSKDSQPAACVPPSLFPLGGNALAVFNFELRYPLTSRLRLAPFYDLGNVFRRVSDFRFSDMTNTVGLGMRINTPLGPLGVDYGFLIDPPAYSASNGAILRQPRGAFHIRFGQTF